MRFTVERKMLAGLGAILLLMIVVGAVCDHSMSELSASSRRVERMQETRHSARDVLIAMDDLETGLRGYVITGQDPFLDPYHAASAVVDQRMAELSTQMGAGSGPSNPFAQLQSLIVAERDFSQSTVELRRSAGLEAAAAAIRGGRGKQLMDEIRGAIGLIVQTQDASLTADNQLAEQQARRTIWIIRAASVMGTLLVLGAYLLIHHDLGQRRRAENQLRESEERFRTLVDSAKDYAIYALDKEGCVQTWNAGARRIKGYEADEIVGQHFSRFYLPEDVRAGKPARDLMLASENGQYEEEGWRVRKDGSRFWANVVIARLTDDRGQHVGFSKITRDLTERQRAEEQFSSFFTYALDLLCIAGMDGYFKRLNPAWEKVFGYTPQELCATPYLDFVHPDDRGATLAVAKQVEAGERVLKFENRYRCKDGSYRWLTWTSVLSSDGQHYAAARDVTDSRNAANAIAELNAALGRQNAQLEAANKELEAFSYSVSHDLRAPLRGLDGFSQALLEDYAPRLDEEGRDHLNRIRAASQRMAQLIDDMLNLSRVSRVELSRRKVDLSQLARDVVQEIRGQSPQREVEVTIADGLTADADSRLMRLVLQNLFGNAWKFTAKQPAARIEFGSMEKDESAGVFRSGQRSRIRHGIRR